MPDIILAIDQGTTSTRAIVFDTRLKPLGSARRSSGSSFPSRAGSSMTRRKSGRGVLAVAKAALKKAKPAPQQVKAIGITNQRETTVVWDRTTGKPIHNAIVWQDRRTAPTLRGAEGRRATRRQFTEKTGLLLDPYFSGTKIRWLLDNVKGARERAEKGELAFGTIDSFLIWRLTGGKVHATDATNASRTLLYNIRHGRVGRGTAAAFSTFRRACCRRSRIAPPISARRTAELFGAAIPILWRGRRPAGGDASARPASSRA